MNVRKLLEDASQLIERQVNVSGWVVCRQKELYLIDVDIDAGTYNYDDDKTKIKLKDRDILYSLLDAIIFPFVGRHGGLFHMAFVDGRLLHSNGELLLDVDAMVIEDDQLNEDRTLSPILIPVDISEATIAEAKRRDPHLFSDNPSGDWLDHMLKYE